jgi:hypothetical protein
MLARHLYSPPGSGEIDEVQTRGVQRQYLYLCTGIYTFVLVDECTFSDTRRAASVFVLVHWYIHFCTSRRMHLFGSGEIDEVEDTAACFLVFLVLHGHLERQHAVRT